MANPQTEHGFTRISNEIMEALARIRINGEAWQVLNVILRKTYGFNKKEDKISLSQFVLSTLIKRPNVCRALNKLKTMRIIIQIDNGNIQSYRFNKDFDTWVSLSKTIQGVSKLITPIIQIDNKSLSKTIHTKEIDTKDTITKENNEDIKKLMDIFYRINPMMDYRKPFNRKAAADLIKKFGLEDTLRMAEQIVAVQGKPYAPVATTPDQMKQKLAQFKIYFDSQKNKSSKVLIINE